MNRAPSLDKINKLVKRVAGEAPRMPTFPIGSMVMPADYILGAIFGASHPMRERKHIRLRNVPLGDGTELGYAGPQLTQVHADLLMATLALAGGESDLVIVRFRDLEALLGRSAGRRNRESLSELLCDLCGAVVERRWLSDGRKQRGGLLPWQLEHVVGGEVELHVQVTVELVELVLRNVRPVELELRKRLARKPAAQWLQLYLPGAPRLVALTELQALMRAAGEPRHFRRGVLEALQALEVVGARVGQWRLSESGAELERVASA